MESTSPCLTSQTISTTGWLHKFSYFSRHFHCTTYRGQMSDPLQISASIIQGFAVGPRVIVSASDLAAYVTPGNILRKYADDTYIIIPAQNVDTRSAELLNIEAWSRENNLTLNTTKSVEILFTDKYRKCQFKPPPVVSGIDRVSSIKILDVTLTSKLSVTDHIHNIIKDCAPVLYALCILRAHGMNQSAVQTAS